MKFDVVGIRLVKERTIEYETQINSPQTAVEIIANELKDMDREMMMSVNFNVKNQIINAHVISVGGIDFAGVDVKNIMKSALLSNANGIMIFHNHPSGLSNPSREDKNVTDKIKQACRCMDIKLLDHIVLGQDTCYSFQFDKYFEYPSITEYVMDEDVETHILLDEIDVSSIQLGEDKSYYKESDIDPNWTIYDQTVASSHLNNYGIIFCDKEYGTPIDDEYELETIVRAEIPDYFEEDEENQEDESWCIE